MKLYVFDINFNRLGIIEEYSDIEFNQKTKDHSLLYLTVPPTDRNIELLVSWAEGDYRILTRDNDITRGFLIEKPEYIEGEQQEINITARSLSVFTGLRIVEGFQIFSGNVGDVIKSFINANAINPSNVNRKIPNLVLSSDNNITSTTEEAYANNELDVVIWDICSRFDVMFEILMDHTNKQYVARVYSGADRTTDQTINPHVIFSKEFDNIVVQSYVKDISGHKNTVYVMGGDKTQDEMFGTILEINSSNSGYNRKEMFVEASDIRPTYRDENDVEVTLTEEQFETLLVERGLTRLAEYTPVESFDSEINPFSQHVFNVDYFLGDLITVRSRNIGVAVNVRVANVSETYNRNGYSMRIEFGSGVPTLMDKIKRKVK